MPGFFKSEFDEGKSLIENFNLKCRLLSPKRSDETKELVEYLKLYKLSYTKKKRGSTLRELREDFAILLKAEDAIGDWLLKREFFSSRVKRIKELQTFIGKLKENIATLEMGHAVHQPTKWTRLTLRGRDEFTSYLPQSLCNELKLLKEIKEKQKVSQTEKMRLIKQIAIFGPLLNYILDFNCLDYLFDSMNFGLELVKVF
ncbi:MAG: hypothetical protein EPO11_09880 [Gammaproteobacteria bacterium]|nr:MAG: hypothetical protein EPO11_09880 [Gammaproteobacteria bacterium]